MTKLIEITDITDPQLAMFANLTEHQLRNRKDPEQGIFIAESSKVIHVALVAGCEPIALLMERKRVAGQAQPIIAACGDIPVYFGERDILAALTGYALTRGILCAMKRPVLPMVSEICGAARRIVVLAGITDAVNIGAIFRSAAALGMDAVLVTQDCCDPFCRRAVRVSMGTLFQIPWTRVDDPISTLQHYGFKTAAMALCDNAIGINDARLADAEKLALVFGTEGDGLPESIIRSSDYVVKIPMAHGVDSLNVAASSAVAFWVLRKNSRQEPGVRSQ